jgi:outer membrane receptor protein involved in Fe transport
LPSLVFPEFFLELVFPELGTTVQTQLEIFMPAHYSPLLLTAVRGFCYWTGFCWAAQAIAQDAPALEEIIVTATKRPQSLQEIPLSVAAVTGDKLNETGTKDLAELTSLVPNIHFTQTGLSTQLRIRGIGSDNSPGFEQSVGVYKDGIFHGRAPLFRAPVFDMDRIEVVRGPQSTLFGKNSNAGALDLITARPTDALTGSLTASYEAEFGAAEITSVVSGPLTDTLRARVALRKADDPGYFENTFKGTDEPDQDISSGRFSFEWDANEDVLVRYAGEYNAFDVLGRPIEITQDLPNGLGANYSAILASLGQPALDSQQDYKRQTNDPEFSNNTSKSHTLTVEWDLEGYTFTSLTGGVFYDYDENCDCDFTAASIIDLALAEDYSQYSQEMRISSPQGKKVEWLAGVFLQTYEQNFNDFLKLPSDSLIVGAVGAATASATYEAVVAGAAANIAQAQNIPLEQARALAEQNPQVVATANATAQGAAQAVVADFGDSGVTRQFNQQSNLQAVFGQATWNIADNFRFILGGRYSNETKLGTKEVHTVDIVTGENQPINPALTANGLPSAAVIYASDTFKADTEEFMGHNVRQTRSEPAFTPLIIGQWDINDTNSAYLSWTTGFKAGGFDPRSNRVTAFEFEEEKARAIELGYKATVFENRGEINLALFRTDYENLQVSQFDGAVGFNVGNAKDTRVQGLEIDGRVSLSRHLQANYGLSLLDFEYQNFKNGNCYFGQDGVDTSGDGIEECDYSGLSGVYTPEYTINLGFDYRRDLTAKLNFAALLDSQFVAGQQVHVNLDPTGEIDAYSLVSLRLQIGGEHWHLALLGKNLLDEQVITYSANAPLSESSFGTNTFYSFVNRPRTAALEASFKF